MKTKVKIFLILLLSIASHKTILAQDDATRVKHYNIEKGIMLSGYDPVSYFSGKPVKGKSTLLCKYKSSVYQFSSQVNLDKFKAEPAKYEPAYGGWCAYAMGAKGEKVEVDPETFKITSGKLYLFYHSLFSNTLNDWNEDETNLKKKADTNWTNTTKQ
jgi:YHS domain-containing protein